MPPSAKPKPPHRIELTANSLRNTTFATDDDSFYYEVVTRYWHPNLTKINKTDMETREVSVAAEIERIPGSEPRVRFGEKGEWVSASQFVKFDHEKVYVSFISLDWMATNARAFFSGGTYIGNGDVPYKWRTNKGRLQV